MLGSIPLNKSQNSRTNIREHRAAKFDTTFMFVNIMTGYDGLGKLHFS